MLTIILGIICCIPALCAIIGGIGALLIYFREDKKEDDVNLTITIEFPKDLIDEISGDQNTNRSDRQIES